MTEIKDKTSVLFVCMGNICRSPTAEGVFRKMVADAGLEDRIVVDSAGTHAYHAGEPPDHRAITAAERRGYSLLSLAARRVHETDFLESAYILAMDDDNLQALKESGAPEFHGKISLFLKTAGVSAVHEVPDPYYGGSAGFERVLDLIEESSAALLETIRKSL